MAAFADAVTRVADIDKVREPDKAYANHGNGPALPKVATEGKQSEQWLEAYQAAKKVA